MQADGAPVWSGRDARVVSDRGLAEALGRVTALEEDVAASSAVARASEGEVARLRGQGGEMGRMMGETRTALGKRQAEVRRRVFAWWRSVVKHAFTMGRLEGRVEGVKRGVDNVSH